MPGISQFLCFSLLVFYAVIGKNIYQKFKYDKLIRNYEVKRMIIKI